MEVRMAYEVEIKELASEQLASTRGWYPLSDLAQVMGAQFGRIIAAITAQGLQPAGPPVAIYHAWTEEKVDVELGFPASGEFNEAQGIKPSSIPGGRVAFTVHVGPYDTIELAYKAMQEYAEAHGLVMSPLMWERYLTDPDKEPDLNKHVTHAYWPLS
jgi:effector-binding domain-containing protein